RVVVMRKGVLQQAAPPQVLYEQPANLFVATFIGSPAMNLAEALLEREGTSLVCRVGEQAIAVDPAAVAERPQLSAYIGRRIALGIRPEHLQDGELQPEAPPSQRLQGYAHITETLGPELLTHVELAAAPVVSAEVLEVAGDVDEALLVELKAE